MIKRFIAVILACSLCGIMFGCTPASGGGTPSGEQGAPVTELTYFYAETINDDSVVIPVSAPDQSLYYYETLVDDTVDLKRAYSEIVYAATHLSNPNADFGNVSDVYFHEGLSAEQLDKVYNAVYFDHPELWYLRQSDKNGCQLHPENNRLAYLTYDEDIADIPGIDSDIAEAVDKVLSGMQDSLAPIDKLAYLSGYMYDNYRIDWPSYNETQHSTIKEMMLEKHGVCIGYAATLTYLLHQAGFSAITGHGKVSTGMEHCWTIFEHNGVYTYTDNYYMKDKGGGTERSIAMFFCFDDIDIYNKEYVTVHSDVLLPGYPVGSGVTAGNSDSYVTNDNSSVESVPEDNTSSETVSSETSSGVEG